MRVDAIARRLSLMALDAVLLAASFWLSFALRLWDHHHSPSLLGNLYLLPWALSIALPVLLLSGWYRGLTRFSGSHSLYSLVPRTGVIVLLLLLVSTLTANPTPPFRGFWLLFWSLFTGSLISSRILLRDLLRYWLARQQDKAMARSAAAANQSPAAIPTLVFGAGQAADLLLAELRHQSRYALVAVIDDDPRLWGRQLHALPILPPGALPKLIERHGIRQVLLAIPSASDARRRELVKQLSGLGLVVLSIPSLSRIAAGEQVVSDLRPVSIEELLRRDPNPADPALMRDAIQGRSVLVTGAGGSIGSELCRQILRHGPTRLVLFERNEFALYSIEQELHHLAAAQQDPDLDKTTLVPVLGDVADQPRLRGLLERYAIQVLFHAAAYKHVPLIESNVCAAVANNLLGTRSALEAAIACRVERFILISTDKAVRPTNAMGASKRACELLVQAAASQQGHGVICAMVRFGNVLGSSGSVVPLFHRQIAAGGPLTVTHPEIVRYFMTIPEAAQLVLQAAAMARGGEVFLLDMGEPVRIVDLARQMIQLSGLSVRDDSHPDGDIPIVFTGLRPGEKLYEELLLSAFDAPTAHPLIRQAREVGLPPSRLETLLAAMERAVTTWDDREVLHLLQEMVPEFSPAQVLPLPAQPRS